MKLKEGDVFTMPISELEIGFGQIVKIPNKETFIIVVYKQVYKAGEMPPLEKVCAGDLLFFGYTMDALLYHKRWEIIGNNLTNIDKIKLPYYKLGTPPNLCITDFKGKKIRKSTAVDFNKLEYLTVVAPIRFELALKAYNNIGEWKNYYDELYYIKVLESITTVEKMGNDPS